MAGGRKGGRRGGKTVVPNVIQCRRAQAQAAGQGRTAEQLPEVRQGNLGSRSDGHYRSASIGVRGRLPPAERSHNPTFGPSPISDGVELWICRPWAFLCCEGHASVHHCTTGQEPARGGAVLRRSRGPTRRCEAERAPGTPLGLSTAWRGRVWRVARRVAPPGARRSGRRGRALEAGVKAPAAALRCAAGGDGSLLVSCSGACSGRCVRCVAARLRAGRSVVRRSGRAGCGRGALRGGLRFVRARGPGPVRTAAPRGTSLPHVRGLHARTPPRARRLPQQADSVADTTQPPPVAVLPAGAAGAAGARWRSL